MTGYNFSMPKMAFLFFRSRSGSTFFGERLSRHPEVLVTPESNVAPRLIKYFKYRRRKNINREELIEYIYNEQKFNDWGFPQSHLVQVLSEYEELDWSVAFYACCKAYRDWTKPEAVVVVFKKSGYHKYVDLLLSTFTDSMTLWMIRDPRSIYNSARKALHSQKKQPMARSVLKNAFQWRDYINRLNKARKRWDGRITKVQYELLLLDLSGVLTRTWQQLGVANLSEPGLAELLEICHASHLITPSTKHLHENVLQKPMIERAKKWETELPNWKARLIQYICKRGMRQFGYHEA